MYRRRQGLFIRKLKEMKIGKSDRVAYIHQQKEALKARKRVCSPRNHLLNVLILLTPLSACLAVFLVETRSGQETDKRDIGYKNEQEQQVSISPLFP